MGLILIRKVLKSLLASKLHNYETHVTRTLVRWRQRAIFLNHNWLLKLTYQFFFAHCVLSTCWISTFVLSNPIKRTFLIGKEIKVPLRFNKIFFHLSLKNHNPILRHGILVKKNYFSFKLTAVFFSKSSFTKVENFYLAQDCTFIQ